MKNSFKPGDWVRLGHRIKDGYGDTWHDAGDVVQVECIAKDGEGLMFASQMGIHFSQVTASPHPKLIGKFFGQSLQVANR